MSQELAQIQYWLDRISKLEKQVDHYKNKAKYLDKRELELLSEINSLEKDLHMIQRHYDQLEMFSPSGNNAQDVGNTNINLPNGREMNAYELADEIDSIVKDWLGQEKSGKLANMLRRQADRIAELEKNLHMVQRHYDQLNLPDGYVVVCVHCAKELKIEFDEFQVLTDNEILQIYADIDGGGIIKFARAIESRLSAKIAKYEEVLNAIANDYHELSDHKIEVQVRNHKKWAREALK